MVRESSVTLLRPYRHMCLSRSGKKLISTATRVTWRVNMTIGWLEMGYSAELTIQSLSRSANEPKALKIPYATH
jgi:hypothetical protein